MVRLRYPDELPVSANRGKILSAVRANPVVIVCGDTGSGKTTQLPKMALELGLARGHRRIAVTQPRRLAAVTMAERVAEETGGEVGGLVGYHHRYARKVSRETRIEFMTDGVLLAETKSDPLLGVYDCIIVDEAHERSLNVDFLLGILARILARRRDLKVIIASATMDTAKFAAFFNAPVIDVPGRLFPIETRHLAPAKDDETADLPRLVGRALDTLPPSADTLVFLSGERDIRETAEYLRGARPADDIIPLLASLPAAEQRRAFTLSPRRRIVLATNVAETSVTIPGIRAVIDSGLARISRYVHRTQIQRLQVEPISQASARQRAGRCGRLGPGVCIRLYSEEDLAARDDYTAPEILRSSLAGVILTMLDLGLGDIERFPFIDPPKPTMVRDGFKELLELGAIRHGTNGAELTEIGRKLARIPVEPRLARILLAASERGVLATTLPIVAALACDDPRRRPIDEKEKASQAHAKFRVTGSDFLSTLALWDWWRKESDGLSQTKARKLAKANYLAWPKLREWTDLARQLDTLCRRTGFSFAEAKDPESILLHQSLLSGFLGRIGHYHAEDREYRGTHALRFSLHPGSVLAKASKRQPPEWIMAGELVDTARLFARDAAIIDPRWIEPLAKGICRHHVHSPFWDAQSGFVRATEQVTLYGLVIVEARRCDYSRFAPEEAREIFFRHGLIGGEFPRPSPVIRETTAFLRRLRDLAEKKRRPEIFDTDRLLAHFVAALPPAVTNADALRRHLAHGGAKAVERFRLRKEDWWPDTVDTDNDFPDRITIGKATLHLSYRNTPDDPSTDGITCTVRQRDAAALGVWRDDWLVPGLLAKKVSYLLLCLPNSLQRLLKPLDDSLAILLGSLKPGAAPLEDDIRRAVNERWAFRIPADAWAKAKIPAYLKVRFVVKDDETGRTLVDTREKDEALALAEDTTCLPVPEPPEKILAEQLSGRLPFSIRGKFPLEIDLYLKEYDYPEEEFKADIREGAIRASITDDGRGIVSDAILLQAEAEIYRIARETAEKTAQIESLMSGGHYPETTTDDVREQIAWLMFKGFPKFVPLEILRRYARYLKAIGIRLERARVNPSSDRAKYARFNPYWKRYADAIASRGRKDTRKLDEYRWLCEEFRLQTFAQELKTFVPVSPRRLDDVLR